MRLRPSSSNAMRNPPRTTFLSARKSRAKESEAAPATGTTIQEFNGEVKTCGKEWFLFPCFLEPRGHSAFRKQASPKHSHKRSRPGLDDRRDRKSTRLNSSHVRISYA